LEIPLGLGEVEQATATIPIIRIEILFMVYDFSKA
jgi:hypothetical protein